MPTVRILTTLRTPGFYGVSCWSAGSACSKAQVRRVPFRKRRPLIRVQRESVNSNRPEFLPTVRYRQSIRQRSRLTIYNRKAPLSAGLLGCSIAASYHLPLYLSPSDGLHIEAGLAPPIQKLLHAVGMLCIDYYEACPRKNRAKKICWDFVRAIFNTSVWLQAG